MFPSTSIQRVAVCLAMNVAAIRRRGESLRTSARARGEALRRERQESSGRQAAVTFIDAPAQTRCDKWSARRRERSSDVAHKKQLIAGRALRVELGSIATGKVEFQTILTTSPCSAPATEDEHESDEMGANSTRIQSINAAPRLRSLLRHRRAGRIDAAALFAHPPHTNRETCRPQRADSPAAGAASLGVAPAATAAPGRHAGQPGRSRC